MTHVVSSRDVTQVVGQVVWQVVAQSESNKWCGRTSGVASGQTNDLIRSAKWCDNSLDSHMLTRASSGECT